MFIIVSDDERPKENKKPEQEAGHHLQLFLIVTELLIFIFWPLKLMEAAANE